MTSFTFDDGIPAANNNPSNDQPKMLRNNISTKQILAVDHVSFDSTGSGGAGSSGGQHLKVTYNSKFAPGAMTDPISIGYTKNGIASPIADLYFKNQNGTFLTNAIRAFGYASGTVASPGNSIIASQSLNVTSVIRTSPGLYTVTLVANAVNGPGPTNNFLVLVSSTGRAVGGNLVFHKYTITGANTFTLLFDNSSAGVGVDVTSFSFIVLQI